MHTRASSSLFRVPFFFFFSLAILCTCFSAMDALGGCDADNKDCIDPKWPVTVIKCFDRSDSVLQCFEELLARKKSEIEARSPNSNSSTDGYGVKRLLSVLDLWEDVLNRHIKREIAGLFKKKRIFGPPSSNATEVGVERKMKMKMQMKNMVPYMLVPGLMIVGLMPWVIPPLNMIVMMVGMMNQMAFSTALFTFVRSYVFDSAQNEHIFYVNHGYKNDKMYHHKYKAHDLKHADHHHDYNEEKGKKGEGKKSDR